MDSRALKRGCRRLSKEHLLLAVWVATQPSCNWDTQRPSDGPRGTQSTLTSNEVASVRAANGLMVTEDDARAKLSELTRLLALSLQEGTTRALVRSSIQSSCFRERKLDFARFTKGPGARVLTAMAAKGGSTGSALSKLIQETPALELYMPVSDHWQRWQSGEDLIVVSSFADNEPLIAFDLQGNAVTGLSPKVPPATPALSLVPAETDFDASCESQSNVQAAGVPPSEFALAQSAVRPGIYLTQTYLQDLGEGWPRGAPEIEAMLIGPVADTLTVGLVSCANESNVTPSYWNQDNNSWTGDVLVADSAHLEQVRRKYPAGTPWSKVRFTIHFWEDDHERCAIATDQEEWKDYFEATVAIVLFGAAWIADDFDSENPFIMGLVAGFNQLRVTLGGNDDNLGYVVNSGAWNPTHPSDPVSTNHAVVRGTTRNGTATLVWRGARPAAVVPPPPFAVTATAPGYVSAKATYTLSGSANYPAQAWKWERSNNGGSTWSVWATTNNSSFTVAAGENYTIRWRLSAKRTSDNVTATAQTSTTVCTVTGGCGPIP